jgi:hypothetical protein
MSLDLTVAVLAYTVWKAQLASVLLIEWRVLSVVQMSSFMLTTIFDLRSDKTTR